MSLNRIKRLLANYQFLLILFLLLGAIGAITKFNSGAYNNYKIFAGVFQHTIEQTSLFAEYPSEYGDVNHYGVLFSLLIAPFSVLPMQWGLTLWMMFSCGVFFWSVREIPMDKWKHIFIYWFCINELYISICYQQYNILVAAFILLSYAFVEKDKPWLAAFFILLGGYTKIYGFGALSFFLFAKRKRTMILALSVWAIALFILPMLISSPTFVINSYVEWFNELLHKNNLNLFQTAQNVSLIGMIRKISANPNYSDLWIIASGLILYLLPLLRVRQYGARNYRLSLLASTLLFIVLFSSGSESSTYIIALSGIAIWLLASPILNKSWRIVIAAFVLWATCGGSLGLMPDLFWRNYYIPYALKAFPCSLVWLVLIGEMMFANYPVEPIQTK